MNDLDTKLRGYNDRLPDIDDVLYDIEIEYTVGINTRWHETIQKFRQLEGFEEFIIRWTGEVDDGDMEYGIYAAFRDTDSLLMAKLTI